MIFGNSFLNKPIASYNGLWLVAKDVVDNLVRSMSSFFFLLYAVTSKSIFRNKCKRKNQASGEGSSPAGNVEINKVISVIE
jgi:hypothetical protein